MQLLQCRDEVSFKVQVHPPAASLEDLQLTCLQVCLPGLDLVWGPGTSCSCCGANEVKVAGGDDWQGGLDLTGATLCITIKVI